MPQSPINPYGWSKLFVERMLRDVVAAEPAFSFAAPRYFNVAGCALDGSVGEHHEPETHLIPVILQAALGKREKVTVFGDDYPTPDGTCIRDYIHVDDLADAHIVAMEALTPGAQLFLNLGIGRGLFGEGDHRYGPGRHGASVHRGGRAPSARRPARALRQSREDPPRARVAGEDHRRATDRRERLGLDERPPRRLRSQEGLSRDVPGGAATSGRLRGSRETKRMSLTPHIEEFLPALRSLHAAIRSDVVQACERSATELMAEVAHDDEGDTIYAVDRVSEERLVTGLEQTASALGPLVLVAEGLPGGRLILPRGTDPAHARWRVIVDPIDGTRGLMYQKRSAWILTGVAPERGDATCLADIELALQTEIPLLKQHLCDSAWALRGQGAHAERTNRLTGEVSPLALRPSRATSIAHGFATVARFFPGQRETLAAIDDEMAFAALGPPRAGKALCFEDQYICSGGQLFELCAGHDRFVADLRPLVARDLVARGLPLGLCCHPYDVCTELIARELGVVVTDPWGGPLRAPLTVEANVAWVGYANDGIRREMEPHLRKALGLRRLLDRAAVPVTGPVSIA